MSTTMLSDIIPTTCVALPDESSRDVSCTASHGTPSGTVAPLCSASCRYRFPTFPVQIPERFRSISPEEVRRLEIDIPVQQELIAMMSGAA